MFVPYYFEVKVTAFLQLFFEALVVKGENLGIGA